MGANNLLVMPGTAASGGVSFGAGSILTLTPQDADAILQDCPAVRAAAPVVRARTQVIYGDRNWVPLFIYGTTPAFLDVRDWRNLAEGRPFTDADVRNGSTVCLLGETVVRELFQGRSPVGKEVRIQSVSFRVVGVLSRKGANMMGMDQDDILLAPWTTIKARVTGSSVGNVNQSSAASSQVNTLDQIYPGSHDRPLPGTLRHPGRGHPHDGAVHQRRPDPGGGGLRGGHPGGHPADHRRCSASGTAFAPTRATTSPFAT